MKKWKSDSSIPLKQNTMEDHRTNWSSLQANSKAWKIVMRTYKHQINVREIAMWICDPQWSDAIRVTQACYYRKQDFKQFQNFLVCPCFTSHLAPLKVWHLFSLPGAQSLRSFLLLFQKGPYKNNSWLHLTAVSSLYNDSQHLHKSVFVSK